MSIDFRLGDCIGALWDVVPDALIVDAPYSERTHSGQSEVRGDLDYEPWTPEHVAAFMGFWAPRTRGWLCSITDDDLAPHWRAAAEAHGRLIFGSVPLLAHMPRMQGDGPGSGTVWLCVSRPRAQRFMSWGSLPSRYDYKREASAVGILGAKPIALMRKLVVDYSKPGDLVVDPCAGGATTLIAAALEGRRAAGAEIDPETYSKALRRITHGNHAVRFPEQGTLF